MWSNVVQQNFKVVKTSICDSQFAFTVIYEMFILFFEFMTKVRLLKYRQFYLKALSMLHMNLSSIVFNAKLVISKLLVMFIYLKPAQKGLLLLKVFISIMYPKVNKWQWSYFSFSIIVYRLCYTSNTSIGFRLQNWWF